MHYSYFAIEKEQDIQGFSFATSDQIVCCALQCPGSGERREIGWYSAAYEWATQTEKRREREGRRAKSAKLCHDW